MTPVSLSSIRVRILIIASLWLLPVTAFVIRYYYVQICRFDHYTKAAQKLYLSKKTTLGRRGEIFDVNGELLIANTPRVLVACSPYSLVREPFAARRESRFESVRAKVPLLEAKRRNFFAWLLAKHFGKDFRYYYRRLEPEPLRRDKKGKIMYDEKGNPRRRRNHFFLISRDATQEQVQAFRKQAELNRLPLNGFLFKDTFARYYPHGRLLANVLGYMNVVNDVDVPQGGLEKQLSRTMTPEKGSMTYEHAMDGTLLVNGIREMQESRDGKNVYLTIREPIQAILEEELDAAYAEWKPEAMYAIIVEPRTGSIWAMGQRPTFDPNDRSTFRGESARTRLAEDSYEPGSVMKPFSVGKALDWGIFRPTDVIDCNKGYWVYAGKPMRDSHSYDKLTVAGVIQKSSNIGTAKIALQMGEANFNRVLDIFQFGQKTHLPFALESRGQARKLNGRDKLAITRMPIGYSIRLTPLQLARAYCALANNGVMPQLRLVDRFEDPETGIVTPAPFAPMRRTFQHPEAIRQLVDMMITVTQPGGTATQAAVKGYDVAGKTGTSRKYIERVGYAPNAYFASFVGFVPAKKPAFVMLVTADHPKGRYYGGTVSGPVFRKTAARVLRYLDIPPDHPEELLSAEEKKNAQAKKR